MSIDITFLFPLTLRSKAASSRGWHSWCLCSLESRHTTHRGSLSSRQKSLNCSPWAVQMPGGLAEHVWNWSPCDKPFFCLRTASQRFLRARLRGGSAFGDNFRQSGHSWVPFVFQNSRRQALQMLWLHASTTGSLKMSRHTGHMRSSSGRADLQDIFLAEMTDSLLVCVIDINTAPVFISMGVWGSSAGAQHTEMERGSKSARRIFYGNWCDVNNKHPPIGSLGLGQMTQINLPTMPFALICERSTLCITLVEVQ